MLFYIILFLICVGILLLANNKKIQKLSFVILWAVYAFRDNVGVDDSSYIRAFEYIQKGWGFDIEWSYQLLAKIADSLGFNYKILFFIYGALSIILLYKAIDLLFDDDHYNKAFYLACFFGTIFVSSLSVMRQFLAACFCFYAAVLYLKSGKIRMPLLLCIVATVFHSGAFLSIPFLLILRPNCKISYSAKMIVLIACVILGYANIASRIITAIMSYLPVSFQIYSNSISGSFSSAGGTLSWLLLILFLGQSAISNMSEADSPEDPMIDVMEKGQFVYLCLLFLFVHAGVASRLAFTFLPFAATLPYTAIERVVQSERKFVKLIVIAGMLVLLVMAVSSAASNQTGAFIPYNASFDFFES